MVDLNAQARRWVLKEAGVRRQGTPGEAPLACFPLERTAMRTLPAVAHDLGVWSQVNVHLEAMSSLIAPGTPLPTR